jgi:hypothetical protein
MAQETWLVSGEKVIDVDGVRRLKVALVAGQINVVGHEEPTARIEVHSVGGRELKISVDGDTLLIDHPQLSWDNFIQAFTSWRDKASAEVTVTVPRDVALKFGVVSASALVTGLTAGASISTVSGDVVVDNVSGDLELGNVSGEISVRNHHGKIVAKTISGGITMSGQIMTFVGDSVSGDVFLDIQGEPEAVKVNTISGDVTTRLEADVAAQYRINTVSGRVQLDNSEITGLRGGYTGKYGELDRHWLEFNAKTVSGNIAVLHEALRV